MTALSAWLALAKAALLAACWAIAVVSARVHHASCPASRKVQLITARAIAAAAALRTIQNALVIPTRDGGEGDAWEQARRRLIDHYRRCLTGGLPERIRFAQSRCALVGERALCDLAVRAELDTIRRLSALGSIRPIVARCLLLEIDLLDTFHRIREASINVPLPSL